MLRRFTSTVTNKVDAKGRVSVPASFRKVLASGEAEDDGLVFLRPNPLGEPVIEGFGQGFFDELVGFAERDPVFGEYDSVSDLLAGSIHQAQLDEAGRIVLPKELRDHAGIAEEATFVGQFSKFAIWNPAAYAAWKAENESRARDRLREMQAARRAAQ